MKMLRFRESFRGYNKDDVNAYIEQVNLRFSRKESELRAQIADLQMMIDRQTSQEPMQEAQNPIVPDSSEEIRALKDVIARLEAENDTLRAQAEKTHAEAETSMNESAEKSRLYDSMSAQVGNILIVANNNAERILEDAKADAERIRADATYHAEAAKIAAKEKMNVRITELQAKLNEAFRQCIVKYEDYVTEASARLTTITDSMRERSRELLISADQQMRTIEKQMQEDCSTADTE